MDCSMMISSVNDCTGGKVEFQSPTYLTDTWPLVGAVKL